MGQLNDSINDKEIKNKQSCMISMLIRCNLNLRELLFSHTLIFSVRKINNYNVTKIIWFFKNAND